MTTPRLGAPELPTGQNASPETMNELGRYIEQGASVFIVKDKDLATPPGSPSQGDCYIVAGSPTGDWNGWTDRLAFRLSTSWEDITPIEGTLAWVQDEDEWYRHSGSAWAAVQASNSQIWTGSVENTFLTPANIYTAAAPVALTSSATVTPNGNSGFNFTLLLGHNATLANPSNFKTGQSGVIVVTQDSGAPWTLAYGTNWKFPGGAPVLSTTAAAIDVITYYVVSGSIIIANLTKAYSS